MWLFSYYEQIIFHQMSSSHFFSEVGSCSDVWIEMIKVALTVSCANRTNIPAGMRHLTSQRWYQIRDHPLAPKWKVFNSDLTASKRDRSTFLHDQANCRQATLTHKHQIIQPVLMRDGGCVADQMQTCGKRWLVEFYLAWLWYPKCWKAFEEMFICF